MNTLVTQLDNREWLSLIIRQTKLRPLITAIVFSVINFLIALALALYFHTWSSSSTTRGLSADFSGLVFYLLVQPVIFGYFCWLQSSIKQLFWQMASEGLFESEMGLRKVLVECRDRLQNKWVSRVAGLLSIAFFVWQVIVYSHYPDKLAWITSHPAIVWLRSPADALAFYALIIVLYDLIIIFTALNNLFKNQLVQVHPFHPDNAGGLGVIGRFTTNLSYGIAVIGIALSLAIIQDPASIFNLTNFGVIIMFILYLFLTPTIFIVPLWSSHLAMIGYRDRLIQEIAKEFDIIFAKMRAQRSSKIAQRDLFLKRIQELNDERNLIYRFPTWPFNSQSVRRFFSIAFSPLVPVIASIVLDLVSKLI